MFIHRNITAHLEKMLSKFPVVALTGPRQSGKTTLLKSAFGHYRYFNLERIDTREMIMSDPVGFLRNAGPEVIFDEAQNLPELFSTIQVISDERNSNGQYILSGSQSFLLNDRITQSLAGRVSLNHLFPFDITELRSAAGRDIAAILLKGFYPRLHDRKIDPGDFYPSYLQTYIERDIRTLKNIENLRTFSRFLSLCAGRIGQVLNLTSLANDAGIAVNTAKSWLSLLESSYIIFLLQPWHFNLNKRIIKSPKLYFYDTGVASSLLRIPGPGNLSLHYLFGYLFENLVIGEIIKYGYHSGKQPSVYYWRESNGVEIDCIIERQTGETVALEIKSGQTFNTDYLKNLKLFPSGKLAGNLKKVVLFTGTESTVISDIRLITWQDFEDDISGFI